MPNSIAFKLSAVAMMSFALIACGGSSESGTVVDQGVEQEENTNIPKKPTTSIFEISDEAVIANGGSVQATQPTLEMNIETISTTTQSTATSLGLNTENRFSIPENNNSIWMKYGGEKGGYVVVKAEFDEIGKASILDAFYDSTIVGVGSRYDRFRSADQKTILAVVPSHKGVTNQFSLHSAGPHNPSGVEGTIIFTELNKEILELSADEFLVDMKSAMQTENCLKEEYVSEGPRMGQNQNYSFRFSYFMVVNLKAKYFRLLNDDVKTYFELNGNEFAYSGVSKAVGHGWNKKSYIAAGKIAIDAEKGTLTDESSGISSYSVNHSQGPDTLKTCEERYVDQGKIILQ